MTVKKSIYFILAVLTSLMLCMDFGQTGYKSIYGDGVFVTIFTLFFIVVESKIYANELKRKWLPIIISMGLSLIWLCTLCHLNNETLAYVVSSGEMLVKAVIYVLGATNFIYLCINAFDVICNKYNKAFVFGSISDLKFYIISVVLIILFWLPHIIICYPGYSYSDSWAEISQYFGQWTFSAGHPVCYTVLIGCFVKLGMLLENTNIGVFLYIIAQTLYAVLVIAYSLLLLRKISAPKWLMIINYLVVLISPYYVNFSCFMVKDFPYAISLLLLVTETISCLVSIDAFLKEKKHLFLIPIGIIGTLLCRHNGKWIVIMLAVVISIYIIKKKICGKHIMKIMVLIYIPMVLSFGLNAYFEQKYEVEERCIAESLCLPLQQTARYCYYYEDELTDYEKTVISSVVNFDGWAEKYTSWTVDPVKGQWYGDKEDVPEFLFVWAKMFLKHPIVYLEASIVQNYKIFYPFNQTVYIVNDLFTSDGQRERMNELGIYEIDTFIEQKESIVNWYDFVLNFPGISLLCNPAFYNLLVIAMFILIICRRMYKCLIPALPVILSTLLFLGPEVHIRYALPFMYPTFVLIGYYIFSVKEKSKFSEV